MSFESFLANLEADALASEEVARRKRDRAVLMSKASCLPEFQGRLQSIASESEQEKEAEAEVARLRDLNSRWETALQAVRVSGLEIRVLESDHEKMEMEIAQKKQAVVAREGRTAAAKDAREEAVRIAREILSGLRKRPSRSKLAELVERKMEDDSAHPLKKRTITEALKAENLP